jgi:phosphoglucomutase
VNISPKAGQPAEPAILIDVPKLVDAYHAGRPDLSVPAQRVVFGTSGHRGCSLDNSFKEAHILAITQSICLYRKQQHIDGLLYIGFDTHALSGPAFKSALEVLAGNDVHVMVDAGSGYTPTPVISISTTTGAAGVVLLMALSLRLPIIRHDSAASNTTRRAAIPLILT